MDFDVIVVGAGHAGCEAALAAARMGCRTAIFTLDRDKIALMPCNPSVGGPGKGHLVREIDALGGEIARNTDRTSVQIRMLNTGKGPAVQSLRAQSDKHAYSKAMTQTIAGQDGLALIEASVDDLILQHDSRGPRVTGIRTGDGRSFYAPSVVLTTGTFLRGRIIVGDESYPGGRAGEFPADALSQSLATAGFTLGRLKTGTPPRVDKNSIDFGLTSIQEGSDKPVFLSYLARRAFEKGVEFAPSSANPICGLDSASAQGRAGCPAPTTEDLRVRGQARSPAPTRMDRPEPGLAGCPAPTAVDEETPSLVTPSGAPHASPATRHTTHNAQRTMHNAQRTTTLFEAHTWRSQLNCFLVHTNEQTHDVIRRNLDRAPMFNGEITATGPRYCPSIEAKIVRFAEKPSHQLFLEPEGWHTDEIYVQGANTSLPAEVQLEMLRTIPALKRAEIVRVGYAIEYDYIPASQVSATLESKLIGGLFLAGQIIGTTGYEEAAALGIMAGINAAHDRESLILRRDQAYIGVLIDDLVTKVLDEPYRMHTSQAEYRLLLREDSAVARLSNTGHDVGLLSDARYADAQARVARIEAALEKLDSVLLTPSVETNAKLESLGADPLVNAMTGREALRRVDISPAILVELGVLDTLPEDVAREVETTAKYEGYIGRQAGEVRRLKRMEERRIPEWVDYAAVQGLRAESREKLTGVRPRTLGQASRIGGIPPSDVALVLFHVERESRQRDANNAQVLPSAE
jgi:tRNA uridine 5-carboxymethylaminomethyl modification enzyme